MSGDEILTRAVEEAIRNNTSGKKTGPNKMRLYMERALPEIVRAVNNGKTINYGQLANAIVAGSARNANRSFGAIYQALRILSVEHPLFVQEGTIPNIALYVSKASGKTSGRGVFFSAPSGLSKVGKQTWLKQEWEKIRQYPRWSEVLAALGLQELTDVLPSVTQAEILSKHGSEGALHKRLKDFIKGNPVVLGISPDALGDTEHLFYSADRIDILFTKKDEFIGVEVKTSDAKLGELTRGVFQCIKYQALLQATELASGRLPNTRVLLALGGALPPELRQLTARLRVHLLQNLEKHLA